MSVVSTNTTVAYCLRKSAGNATCLVSPYWTDRACRIHQTGRTGRHWDWVIARSLRSSAAAGLSTRQATSWTPLPPATLPAPMSGGGCSRVPWWVTLHVDHTGEGCVVGKASGVENRYRSVWQKLKDFRNKISKTSTFIDNSSTGYDTGVAQKTRG